MSVAILLDTNVLLLWAVGGFDQSLIGRARLDEYTADDFRLLDDLIGIYPRILTTPHVLTELSNLADYVVPEYRHDEFREYLSDLIDRMEEVTEVSKVLTKTEAFAELGLADSAVIQFGGGETLILSTDLPLCRFLLARDVEVENFNHYRRLN